MAVMKSDHPGNLNRFNRRAVSNPHLGHLNVQKNERTSCFFMRSSLRTGMRQNQVISTLRWTAQEHEIARLSSTNNIVLRVVALRPNRTCCTVGLAEPSRENLDSALYLTDVWRVNISTLREASRRGIQEILLSHCCSKGLQSARL